VQTTKQWFPKGEKENNPQKSAVVDVLYVTEKLNKAKLSRLLQL
jgi:hypothetical protein